MRQHGVDDLGSGMYVKWIGRKVSNRKTSGREKRKKRKRGGEEGGFYSRAWGGPIHFKPTLELLDSLRQRK